MSSNGKRGLVPLLVVVAGLAIAVVLVTSAPETEAFVPERAVPTVRVAEVERAAVRAVVGRARALRRRAFDAQ